MFNDHPPAAKARVVSLLETYRHHFRLGLNLDHVAERFMDLAYLQRPEAARILAVRLSSIPVWYEEFAKGGLPAKLAPGDVERAERAGMLERILGPGPDPGAGYVDADQGYHPYPA